MLAMSTSQAMSAAPSCSGTSRDPGSGIRDSGFEGFHHRLSTIRAADRIIVFDQGRVVAQGKHDELMMSSPLYAQLTDQLKDVASQQVTPALAAAR